jgi:hypothetical protein
MAHGMLADDAFSSTDALYIWWLILHLTIAFHPSAASSDDKPKEDPPTSNGGVPESEQQ